MIRVAFDARSLAKPYLRGMDRYLLGLAEHLAEFDIAPTMLYRACEPIPEMFRIPAANWIGLGDYGGISWEQVSVPREILRGGYDLYHSPAERLVPLAIPCPAVFTFHSATDLSYQRMVARGMLPGRVEDYLGYDPRSRDRKPGMWYHTACIRAGVSHMITVSRFARDEIVDLYRWPASRISVTPLGLPSLFLKEPSVPEQRRATLEKLRLRPPYVLNVGGYEPHKNVRGLLEAFAKLRRPGLTLAVAGTSAPPSDILETIRHQNLMDSVVTLSNLGENLLDVYDGAAAFATLSWRESFGLPALEAMSRGVPVVASAWGAAPEVIGPYGLLVDPRDTESAATAIAATLDSPVDPDVLRSHARTFQWRHTAELTAAIYRELLVPRRRRFRTIR